MDQTPPELSRKEQWQQNMRACVTCRRVLYASKFPNPTSPDCRDCRRVASRKVCQDCQAAKPLGAFKPKTALTCHACLRLWKKHHEQATQHARGVPLNKHQVEAAAARLRRAAAKRASLEAAAAAGVELTRLQRSMLHRPLPVAVPLGVSPISPEAFRLRAEAGLPQIVRRKCTHCGFMKASDQFRTGWRVCKSCVIENGTLR